jgi:transposase
MRGSDVTTGSLFSYVDLDARVPKRHPLRLIREIVNEVLSEMSADFEVMYAATGRPSIPPEQLLRALLLQAFYSIRSERQLMEQLEFNLLFCWFVGLGVDGRVWDASTFSHNRERFLASEISHRLLAGIVNHPRVRALLSRDHFSVDGTLIQAWASVKSFRPRGDGDGNGGGEDADARPAASIDESGGGGSGRNSTRDFHGERWSNETHASTTDGDGLLYRKGKGKESRLCYLGHAMMENRNGLVVDGLVSRATGTAERDAAWIMASRRPERGRRITLGADKAHDTTDFVADGTAIGVTVHAAQNTTNRRSAVPDEVAASEGYARSQTIRKRIEEVFGWTKSSAGKARTLFRGLERVDLGFGFDLAAYNLIRLPRLLGALPP